MNPQGRYTKDDSATAEVCRYRRGSRVVVWQKDPKSKKDVNSMESQWGKPIEPPAKSHRNSARRKGEVKLITLLNVHEKFI